MSHTMLQHCGPHQVVKQNPPTSPGRVLTSHLTAEALKVRMGVKCMYLLILLIWFCMGVGT